MALDLSRRDILKLAAAGAGWSLTRSAGAFWFPQSQKSLTFAYFSDTHVGLKARVEDTRRMLGEIQALMKPAFAVNGGDITDYGWDGEYANYKTVKSEFPFPILDVPGNHDVRWSPLGMKVFRKHLGSPFQSRKETGLLVVALDSTVPLSHWGHFERSQLDWLADTLAQFGKENPVVLAMHHWVGRGAMMADNENELLEAIEPYNVKLILTGHGHSDLLWRWNGILCTQNKGLYQGSYQKIGVDFVGNALSLSRRTEQNPTLQEIARIPLNSDQLPRPKWNLSRESWEQGQKVEGNLAGVQEYRWDGGEVQSFAEGIPTGALVPGFHTLGLRNGPDGLLVNVAVRITSPESRLTPIWQKRLSGGVMSHVKTDRQRVYVSCMDGSVHAIRKADGQSLWVAKTEDYCHSSPWIENGTVWVGSADGCIYAFDAASGERKWRKATRGPVYASPAQTQGIVGIASGDGRIYGLDASSGAERWVYELPTGNTNFAQSMAATDGQRFYVGAWDNHVYALDVKTGRLLWRQPCCPTTFAYSPAIGSPCVDKGRVYASANGNRLFSFVSETGEKVWEVPSKGDKYGHSGPVAVGDRVVVGCLGDNGEVRCVSAKDGSEIWTTKTGSVIYDSSPTVWNGQVAIGSVDALISVVNLQDGALLAQFRLPHGHVLSSPAFDGGTIYAASYNNELLALRFR